MKKSLIISVLALVLAFSPLALGAQTTSSQTPENNSISREELLELIRSLQAQLDMLTRLVQSYNNQPVTTPTQPYFNAGITVLSPNGGEIWKINSEHLITWSNKSSGELYHSSAVDIRLVGYPASYISCQSYDSDRCWPSSEVLIAKNLRNTGVYKWYKWIGNVKGGLSEGLYKIQICLTGTSNCDTSDSYFKLINDNDNNGNRPPVVHGVSGPTRLEVGERGTWTVNASDPENGQLTYSVIWGDGTPAPSADEGSGFPAAQTFTQTATFTHTYSRVGSFYPQFFVRDEAGSSNGTGLSVRVVGDEAEDFLDFEVMSFELNQHGPFVRFCNRSTYGVNDFPVRIEINGVVREFNMQGHQEPMARCGLSHQWYYATWGLELPGEFEGRVLVDPLDIYEESQEGNNQLKARANLSGV